LRFPAAADVIGWTVARSKMPIMRAGEAWFDRTQKTTNELCAAIIGRNIRWIWMSSMCWRPRPTNGSFNLSLSINRTLDFTAVTQQVIIHLSSCCDGTSFWKGHERRILTVSRHLCEILREKHGTVVQC
jgi:hypothetical protein